MGAAERDMDPLYGARVRREVNGETFNGIVIYIEVGIVSRERLYLIRYEDGDLEHFTKEQVIEFKIAAPTTAPTAAPTATTTTALTATPPASPNAASTATPQPRPQPRPQPAVVTFGSRAVAGCGRVPPRRVVRTDESWRTDLRETAPRRLSVIEASPPSTRPRHQPDCGTDGDADSRAHSRAHSYPDGGTDGGAHSRAHSHPDNGTDGDAHS